MEVTRIKKHFEIVKAPKRIRWLFRTTEKKNKHLIACIDELMKLGYISEVDFLKTKFSLEPGDNEEIYFARVCAKSNFPGVTQRIVGSGEGSEENEAILKALAEFMERLSGFSAKFFPDLAREPGSTTSNGCAVYQNLKDARRKAYCELIERDAFLCHWYTNTRARTIPDEMFFENLKHSLERDGFFCRSFLLNALDPEVFVVLVLIQRKEYVSNLFNCFIGLGAAADLNSALLIAKREALRFYNLYFLQNSSVSQDEVNKSGFHQVDVKRLMMVQSLEMANAFDFLQTGLLPSDNDAKTSFVLSASKFQLLPLPKILAGFLVSVRCINPFLQDLDYFEKPKLNIERLRRFSQSFSEDDVRLHPIP